MVTYAIGDIQGCNHSLAALRARLAEQAPAPDRLWLAGDLVNRGPDSLAVLRFARTAGLAGELDTVLGNHDLHLLACAHGVAAPSKRDTLDAILAAPDREDLLHWLLQQPFLLRTQVGSGADSVRFVLTHAGLLPEWNVEQATAHAAELSEALRNDPRSTLAACASAPAPRWDDTLRGTRRLSTLAAAFTRLRVVAPDGSLMLNFKGPPAEAPGGSRPWFRAPERRWSDGRTVALAGHWAALGLHLQSDAIALDSGCVWGGRLTAVRLSADPAERQVVSVDCAAPDRPPDRGE